MPVLECYQIPRFLVKMEGFSLSAASVCRGGRAEIGAEVLKNGRENRPYGTFLRRGGRFHAAKTGFLC